MPSWPRITIQVEPQIAVKMMNGMTTDRAEAARLGVQFVASRRWRGFIADVLVVGSTCANQWRGRGDKLGLCVPSQRGDCGGEPVERLALLVPAGDEPDFARPPVVEIEALARAAARPRRR